MTLTITVQGGTPKSDADMCANCSYSVRQTTVDSQRITYCRALENMVIRTRLAECSQWERLEFKASGQPALLHRTDKDEIVWHDGWGRQIRPALKKRKKRKVGLVQLNSVAVQQETATTAAQAEEKS